MYLFFVGLIILLGGGFLYGRYCERVFGPDDRPTPAVSLQDGVDFVGMKSWKNQLIELLNIAGTGPVFGPIQGILFGPIAFLTIPLGCVLAGSLHDYFVGMISMRSNGYQIPKMMKTYVGKGTSNIYNIIIWVLMLLTGVVFIYTPGDLIVSQILGIKDAGIWLFFIVYGIIMLYYIASTIFPIDKIIGRIYPVFGAILLISALGVLFGVFTSGLPQLHNITEGALISKHPLGQSFIPVFFITVACGIMSGFHGSQATLISRTVTSEHEGRKTFYNMMIVEGLIAMCWAAGAMVVFNEGQDLTTAATAMVGEISRRFLGNFGGYLAILGVIVLPITSGDTAFRSLRLMISETFDIPQKAASKRIALTMALFIPAFAILWFAKVNANGFNMLWQYFGFTNQLVAVFALMLITIYLRAHGKNWLISAIPGMVYTFIVMSYIFHDNKLGFHLDKLILHNPDTYLLSYILGVICAGLFLFFVIKRSDRNKQHIIHWDPQHPTYVK